MRVLLAIAIALAIAAPAGAVTLPYRHGHVHRAVRTNPARPTASHHPAASPATQTAAKQTPATQTPATQAPGTQTPGTQTAGSATTSAASLVDVEQALLSAVNAARAANGLGALAIDSSLESAARAHTQDLLANAAFTHDFVDASGSTPFGSWIGRYYRGNCAGENLATGSPTLSADQAVQLWLNSPGHRANMLSARFTTIGVALQGSNGTWIATTDFGGC